MKTSLRKRASQQLPIETMHAIMKWHTIIIVGCAIAAYYCAVHSYSGFTAYDAKHANYNVQLLGALFLFLEAAFVYSLNTLQDGAYWIPWLRLKKIKLDERQTAVRQRVFERAFVITILILFTMTPVIFGWLAQYSNPARSALFHQAAWTIGICLVSLPAMLAAWQKDS